MQTSKTKLITDSEINLDDIDPHDYNQDRHSSQEIKQLACCLKHTIFSKHVSNYLIDKTEEMWTLYEKRIDKILQEKHFDMTCHQTRPQTAIRLEELIRQQQRKLVVCQRDFELLCSSRKRLRNDDKYSIRSQSTQQAVASGNSIRAPKTPRCIDRYKVINDNSN